MKKNEKVSSQSKKILEGLEESYKKLVAFKRYKNSPLVVEENNVVVEIPPDEIPDQTKYLCKYSDRQ